MCGHVCVCLCVSSMVKTKGSRDNLSTTRHERSDKGMKRKLRGQSTLCFVGGGGWSGGGSVSTLRNSTVASDSQYVADVQRQVVAGVEERQKRNEAKRDAAARDAAAQGRAATVGAAGGGVGEATTACTYNCEHECAGKAFRVCRAPTSCGLLCAT